MPINNPIPSSAFTNYRIIGTSAIGARKYSAALIAVNSTTATFAKDRIIYQPFKIDETITIDSIGFEITIAGTVASVMRLGIYSDVNGVPTTLLLDSAVDKTSGTGLIACDSATVQSIPISKTLTPGYYYFAMTNNSTSTITGRAHATGGLIGSLGYITTLGASILATAIRSIVTYTAFSGTADLTSYSFTTDAPLITFTRSA